MSDVYIIEMDDEGASTYYLVDHVTFLEAKEADQTQGNDEALMDWFYDQNTDAWPKFYSISDVNFHVKTKGLNLVDDIKGFLY